VGTELRFWMPENLQQALNTANTVYIALELEDQSRRERIFKTGTRPIVCYRCNKWGHMAKNCTADRGAYSQRDYHKGNQARYRQANSGDKVDIHCWACNELGHSSGHIC
jgi:hypothetical protein